MPPDSRFRELLADPRNHVRPPPAHVPIEKVRSVANGAMAGPSSVELARVSTLVVPLDGRGIALRLYQPTLGWPLPVILFFHGGGFVWGNLDTHDAICRELAFAANAAVVAVDYRLSPETRYPGQVEDGLAVLRWVARADGYGLDPARIALCGDSAGGNIACAVAMRAGAEGPRPRHLALFYPVLDPACASPSQHEFAEGYVLTRAAMQWFWQCCLGDDGRAGDLLAAGPAALSRLPPVSISTAEFDILRDEGEAFAADLRQAGVAVSLRRYDGMIHGFLSYREAQDVARRAIADIAGDLARALEG